MTNLKILISSSANFKPLFLLWKEIQVDSNMALTCMISHHPRTTSCVGKSTTVSGRGNCECHLTYESTLQELGHHKEIQVKVKATSQASFPWIGSLHSQITIDVIYRHDDKSPQEWLIYWWEPSIPLTGNKRGNIVSFSVLDRIDEPVGMTVEDEEDLYAHPVNHRYWWVPVEWFDSLSCSTILPDIQA